MDDFELRILNQIGISVYISRGAGLVLTFDCAVLLLPMCKNLISVLRSTFLNKWIPFDDAVIFHKMTAYSILFFTLVHVNAHYTNLFWVQVRLGLLKTWQAHYTLWAGFTGHAMLLLMLIIYSTANSKVRFLNHELFYYTHHLSIIFYLVFFCHAIGCFVKSADTGECKGYGAYKFSLVGVILIIIEKIIRYVRSSKHTTLVNGKTMELRIEKPSMSYIPGQYIYVNIPSISKWQWHPFTITSVPEEGFISIHVRVAGDWTSKCLNAFNNSYQIQYPVIKIDGPFGAPGVTPAAGLLKSILYKHKRKSPMNLKKVYFIWMNRDKVAFEWFSELLDNLESQLPPDFLCIQVYLTEKLGIDDIQNIMIRDALETDPITDLTLTRCSYGRPNWYQIFNQVASGFRYEADKKRVGVFYCGPNPMAKMLKRITKELSEPKVRFIFKKEKF